MYTRNIELVNGQSKPIHTRYRYKYPESAIRRAMKLDRRFTQVWDLEKGKEVCTVEKTRKTITIRFP